MLYDHKIGLIVDKKVTQWVEGACIVFWGVFALWTGYFGKVLQWAFVVLFCALGVLLELWCTIEECAIVWCALLLCGLWCILVALGCGIVVWYGGILQCAEQQVL